MAPPNSSNDVATGQRDTIGAREWGNARDREPAGVELRNNHCYRNASFSGLLHLPGLLTALEVHPALCTPGKNPLCLTCKLAHLAKDYWTSAPAYLQESEKSLRSMTDFIHSFNIERDRMEKAKEPTSSPEAISRYEKERDRMLTTRKLTFQGSLKSGQQDIAEFLGWLFHNLGHGTDDETSAATMQRLFETTTKSRWECDQCGEKGNTRAGRSEQTSGIKPLHIRKAHAVEADTERPLQHYLKQDWFRSTLHLTCADCSYAKLHDPAVEDSLDRNVSEDILAAPDYLVLGIASSAGADGLFHVKGGNRVRVPLWLDLNRYKHPEFQGTKDDLRYKLCATVYHHGSSASGHYWGVFTGPKGTRKIDNKNVDKASVSELCWAPVARPLMYSERKIKTTGKIVSEYVGTQPYVLFYKRFGVGSKEDVKKIDERPKADQDKHSKPQSAPSTKSTTPNGGKRSSAKRKSLGGSAGASSISDELHAEKTPSKKRKVGRASARSLRGSK